MKVGFIGAGEMAKAIINGLLKANHVSGSDIYLHSAHANNYEPFAQAKGLVAASTNKEVVQNSDYVVLAVTPDRAADVLRELNDVLTDKVLISIVGGMSIQRLEELTGYNTPILRALPNVNVEITAGMTAIHANEQLNEAQTKQAVGLFEAIGSVSEQPEDKFSIFSAMAGSGPAYVAYFIDAMSRAGVKYGLSKQTATEIAASVVQGSAQLVTESGETPMDVVDAVSSPGGSTVRGLLAMEEAGFMTSIIKCIDATIGQDKKVD